MSEQRKMIKTKDGNEYAVCREEDDAYVVYTGRCDEQGAPYLRNIYKYDVTAKKINDDAYFDECAVHKDIYNQRYIADCEDALKYFQENNTESKRLETSKLKNEANDFAIKAMQYCVVNNIIL